MPNINIPVDDQLHQRLRVAAFEDNRKQTEIVREAIEQWLERRESKTEERRKELLQQRREARAAFEASEITHEEKVAAERAVRQFRSSKRKAREAAAEEVTKVGRGR